MQTILLADDHHLLRHGLRSLLEEDDFEVVAEASDGREAARLARHLQPDIAILDFSMPLMNGIEAARDIRTHAPATRMLLLTMYDEESYTMEGLHAGITGFVHKAQAARDLVLAIREVSRGTTYLNPKISKTLVDGFLYNLGWQRNPLSGRERQVLQLVAESNTTRRIAEILGLSVKTADSHRSRIMQKLDIPDTAGLVRYAIRHGVIKL
jgi:DNA-binding NarL/FixJ family response regulator